MVPPAPRALQNATRYPAGLLHFANIARRDFTVEALEREHILRVLARTVTQEDAARILELDASTLWRKRKKYDEG